MNGTKLTYLIFDIGGTWIKCASFKAGEANLLRTQPEAMTDRIRRAPSPRTAEEFLEGLLKLAGECSGGESPLFVCLSTAGIVHPSGKRLIACADHLAFLRDASWHAKLETALGCSVSLINDAEAFLLGAAERGYVPRVGTLCCLVVGTGLGCAVSKDGRHWRPQRRPSLLGSIRCAGETFDSLASASRFAALGLGKDLAACLLAPELASERERYFSNLSDIVLTAAMLHGADKILLGGGLVDAARAASFDLHAAIWKHWQNCPPELDRLPDLVVAEAGNAVTLLGAASLAVASGDPLSPFEFGSLMTEQTHPAARGLNSRTSREIMGILWQAESDAGRSLEGSLDELADLAEHVIARWPDGGRVIYVGAGTSARIAALDAVEIPCTFGCPPDRVVAVAAGGLTEASLSIEEEGEEDYSSVPDLILLQLRPSDTVIGISASGSAAFVRTALHYARGRGAKTALICTAKAAKSEPWDWTIPLASGVEIVAGSTRMKAGTATKKLLNFLTTTIMTRTGKVRGPYMINMACLNAKAAARANRILRELFSLTESEASALLTSNDYQLNKAIEAAEQS